MPPWHIHPRKQANKQTDRSPTLDGIRTSFLESMSPLPCSAFLMSESVAATMTVLPS